MTDTICDVSYTPTGSVTVTPQSVTKPTMAGEDDRHRCKYCVGAGETGTGSPCAVVEAGSPCGITHKEITGAEIECGCDKWYDKLNTAYLIDVLSNFEYCDYAGNVRRREQYTDRVIRVRDPPEQWDDWRSVYAEALQVRARKIGLTVDSGHWVCSNVYRIGAESARDADSGTVQTIRVGFMTKMTRHPSGGGACGNDVPN